MGIFNKPNTIYKLKSVSFKIGNNGKNTRKSMLMNYLNMICTMKRKCDIASTCFQKKFAF